MKKAALVIGLLAAVMFTSLCFALLVRDVRASSPVATPVARAPTTRSACNQWRCGQEPFTLAPTATQATVVAAPVPTCASAYASAHTHGSRRRH